MPCCVIVKGKKCQNNSLPSICNNPCLLSLDFSSLKGNKARGGISWIIAVKLTQRIWLEKQYFHGTLNWYLHYGSNVKSLASKVFEKIELKNSVLKHNNYMYIIELWDQISRKSLKLKFTNLKHKDTKQSLSHIFSPFTSSYIQYWTIVAIKIIGK